MRLVVSYRIQPDEMEILWLPRSWLPSAQATNPYGVLYIHGHGDTAVSPQDPFNKPGQSAVVRAIVDAGFPLLTMDSGKVGVTPNGTNGWSNATDLARVASAFTYLNRTDIGGKLGKILLVGVSMGALIALNYAKANPTKVAGVIGILPVVDLDDIYQQNRAGLRPSIQTAHGIVHPASLPVGVNPTTSPGALADVPVRFYYDTIDPVASPSIIVSFASSIDAEVVPHGAAGHSEASISVIDVDTLTSWLSART